MWIVGLSSSWQGVSLAMYPHEMHPNGHCYVLAEGSISSVDARTPCVS